MNSCPLASLWSSSHPLPRVEEFKGPPPYIPLDPTTPLLQHACYFSGTLEVLAHILNLVVTVCSSRSVCLQADCTAAMHVVRPELALLVVVG